MRRISGTSRGVRDHGVFGVGMKASASDPPPPPPPASTPTTLLLRRCPPAPPDQGMSPAGPASFSLYVCECPLLDRRSARAPALPRRDVSATSTDAARIGQSSRPSATLPPERGAAPALEAKIARAPSPLRGRGSGVFLTPIRTIVLLVLICFWEEGRRSWSTEVPAIPPA